MIYMIQLDQMKLELQQYEAPMEEVRDSLDLDYKKQRIEELQRESEAPDFWMNADKANQKMKQLKDLQTTVEDADGLVNSYEEIMMMIEMGNEEEDESVVEEVRADLDAFEAKIEEMRLATLRHHQPERGRRRHRELRLVLHALPYVYQVGGQERLYH